jgi:D-glycero-D-manno-heptose 1,7-bisphosphate phosphatase
MASLRPGLLLDRDGVINEDSHYLHDPKDLVVIPGVVETIAAINRQGIPVAVVTNQAGIGRGKYDVQAYQSVNRAIEEQLRTGAARVDAWYFCPHRPDADCPCRKPRPGMLLAAARDLELDLSRSLLVGDKVSDLEAGRAVGATTVLVRTGYGREVEAELLAERRALADHVCDSLRAALPYLVQVLARSLPTHRGIS